MRGSLEEGPRETRQSWAAFWLHFLLEFCWFPLDLQREGSESPLSSACPGTHRKDGTSVDLPSLAALHPEEVFSGLERRRSSGSFSLHDAGDQ